MQIKHASVKKLDILSIYSFSCETRDTPSNVVAFYENETWEWMTSKTNPVLENEHEETTLTISRYSIIGWTGFAWNWTDKWINVKVCELWRVQTKWFQINCDKSW